VSWRSKISRLERLENEAAPKPAPSFTVLKGSPEHARAIMERRPVAVVPKKCATAEEWLELYGKAGLEQDARNRWSIQPSTAKCPKIGVERNRCNALWAVRDP
jgi:hypothetical protein